MRAVRCGCHQTCFVPTVQKTCHFLLFIPVLWLAREERRPFCGGPRPGVLSVRLPDVSVICFRKHRGKPSARAASALGSPETVSARNRQILAKEKFSTSEKGSKSPPVGR